MYWYLIDAGSKTWIAGQILADISILVIIGKIFALMEYNMKYIGIVTGKIMAGGKIIGIGKTLVGPIVLFLELEILCWFHVKICRWWIYKCF